MHGAELQEGEGQHLGRGVELHGAGPERDHGPIQRDVASRQVLQITQHLGLGVIGLEHRMAQEEAAAPEVLRDTVNDLPIQRLDVEERVGTRGEDPPQRP